jgi:hypothetical protein
LNLVAPFARNPNDVAKAQRRRQRLLGLNARPRERTSRPGQRERCDSN